MKKETENLKWTDLKCDSGKTLENGDGLVIVSVSGQYLDLHQTLTPSCKVHEWMKQLKLSCSYRWTRLTSIDECIRGLIYLVWLHCDRRWWTTFRVIVLSCYVSVRVSSWWHFDLWNHGQLCSSVLCRAVIEFLPVLDRPQKAQCSF